MLKPLTVWITTNWGKFLKRWEYQTTLPASWDTGMQVKNQHLKKKKFKKKKKNQQLESDMEQQTGSKTVWHFNNW